jgi:hypothetical protein
MQIRRRTDHQQALLCFLILVSPWSHGGGTKKISELQTILDTSRTCKSLVFGLCVQYRSNFFTPIPDFPHISSHPDNVPIGTPTSLTALVSFRSAAVAIFFKLKDAPSRDAAHPSQAGQLLPRPTHPRNQANTPMRSGSNGSFQHLQLQGSLVALGVVDFECNEFDVKMESFGGVHVAA